MEQLLFTSYQRRRRIKIRVRKENKFIHKVDRNDGLYYLINWKFDQLLLESISGKQFLDDYPLLDILTVHITSTFVSQKFQYHISFEVFGSSIYQDTFICDYPWQFIANESPCNVFQGERFEMMIKNTQPFEVFCQKDFVRYKDTIGEGYLRNFMETPIRNTSMEELWYNSMCSRFVDHQKMSVISDTWTIIQNVSSEFTGIIKQYAWNLKQCLGIKPEDELARDVRRGFVDLISMNLIHLRFYLRHILLSPLGTGTGRYKVIQGGFDESEKSVLRVTVQFLENLTKMEKITYQFILDYMGESDRFSPKVFKKIMVKTLFAEENINRVIEFMKPHLDSYYQRLEDPALNLTDDRREARVWTYDLRTCWCLLRFVEKFVSGNLKKGYYCANIRTGEIESCSEVLVPIGSRGEIELLLNCSHNIIIIQTADPASGSKSLLSHKKYHMVQSMKRKNPGFIYLVATEEEDDRTYLMRLDFNKSFDSKEISLEKILPLDRGTKVLQLETTENKVFMIQKNDSKTQLTTIKLEKGEGEEEMNDPATSKVHVSHSSQELIDFFTEDYLEFESGIFKSQEDDPLDNVSLGLHASEQGLLLTATKPKTAPFSSVQFSFSPSSPNPRKQRIHKTIEDVHPNHPYSVIDNRKTFYIMYTSAGSNEHNVMYIKNSKFQFIDGVDRLRRLKTVQTRIHSIDDEAFIIVYSDRDVKTVFAIEIIY